MNIFIYHFTEADWIPSLLDLHIGNRAFYIDQYGDYNYIAPSEGYFKNKSRL